MDSLPPPTDQLSLAALHEQDVRDLRALLMEMAHQGAELAGLYVQQAKEQAYAGKPGAGPSPDCATAYKEVTRSVRQSAMLVLKITEPPPKAEAEARPHQSARKQIIRRVEDALYRDAPADQAERLHAEFLERLEGPEFDDELSARPVADIVNDILADLGLLGMDSTQHWPRRTPEDIALLCARAAAAAENWDDTPPIRGP